MRFTTLSVGALALLAATPAFAQDASTTPADAHASASADTPLPEEPAPTKAVTVTGGVTLISEYRFRGLTQTGGDPAAQGTININTRAGFYVGTWASTIHGGGDTPLLAGYGHEEVDLYGGFTKTFHGVGVDAGVLYYYYASAQKGLNTDFFEPYASLSYTIGPVAAKVGAAYAWGGQKGLDFTPGHDDNLYLYGEGSIGIPTTPITLKGHVGHTNGALGLANINPSDDTYWDWSGTVEGVGGPLKVGVSYVDTNISNRRLFATDRRGYAQSRHFGSTVLGYVGISF